MQTSVGAVQTLGRRGLPVDRWYRLDQTPGGLGLACDATGVSLAGAPLLQKAADGFSPRPTADLAALTTAAYGAAIDPDRLARGLAAVSRALNAGDLAKAMMTALALHLPDLDWAAAVRLAQAEHALAKYDPSEPRDRRGRWTTDGGQGASGPRPPSTRPNPAVPAPTSKPHTSVHQPRPSRPPPTRPSPLAAHRSGATPGPTLIPAALRFPPPGPQTPVPAARPAPKTNTSPAAALGLSPSASPEALDAALRKTFDKLSPSDFADRVIRFGWWLGHRRQPLPAADIQTGRQIYGFLQSRLDAWNRNPHKTPKEGNALFSAALNIYTGAVISGVVPVGGKNGGLPRSFLAAAVAAIPFSDGPAAGRGGGLSEIPEFVIPRTMGRSQAAFAAHVEPPEPVGGLGSVVDNKHVGVKWGGGIQEQGAPFEDFVGEQLPNADRLPPGSKRFDYHTEKIGLGTSAKTLDTTSNFYRDNPKNVYSKIKSYVDAVADYKGSKRKIDLKVDQIKSKEIHLGIPDDTTPRQWIQIKKASSYAEERRVKLIITRIR